MGIRFERWLLMPVSCPRPIRYCRTCGVPKEFVCSERFRINAQKKVLDVWLHYRCDECSSTWKYPVLERQSIAAIDAATYEAYVRHDSRMVWKHAFDTGRMRAHVTQVDANVGISVDRIVIAGAVEDDDLCVELEVPFACDIRLDKLLAAELGVSRSAVQYWYDSGQLCILSAKNDVLSKRARTGRRLLLSRVAKFNERPS